MALTSDRTDPSGADNDSPWTKPGFVVSAVLVGLIVLAGIVLTILNLTDHKPTRGAAPQPPAVPGAFPGAATAGSVCGLPAGDQTVPRVAPANTKWQLIGTIAAPAAPTTYGPGRTTSGVPTCFAHSPTGALYAATNFVAASTAPGVGETLIRSAGTGVGQAAALRQANEPPDQAEGSLQVAGFNVLASTEQSVSIDLLFRASSDMASGYVHLTAPMVWQDGTWKWSLPPSGNPYEAFQAVPSTAGYVLWSGA